MTGRHLILLLLFLLGGCNGPSDRALRFEAEVKCGMSVEEVQVLASRPMNEIEFGPRGPRRRITHYVAGGDRYYDDGVRLGFEDGKLRYIQIEWGVPVTTRVVEYPMVDLCAGGEEHPK